MKLFWNRKNRKAERQAMANQRQMDIETIKRINTRLDQFEAAHDLEERWSVLRDWQKEIMISDGTWMGEVEAQ